MKARGHVLELLTTQLISEYLRTVADPGVPPKWARQHLHFLADEMPVETESLAGRSSLVEKNAEVPLEQFYDRVKTCAGRPL
jgi:hypothetical protein